MSSWWPAVLATAVLTTGYAAALVARPRTLPRWSTWRTLAWLSGVLLVGAALSPPVGELAHHDPRAHMVQHLLLGMYAPLGLVIAAPVTLVLGSLPIMAGRRVSGLLRARPVHVLSHPVTAALLNVGGMFALYLTPLLALTHAVPAVHWLVLLHFLLAGGLYTWAIAGPDPAPGRPGLRIRVAVLVIAAGAHAYLAKLLYTRAGEGGAHAMVDEASAQLMYYGGDGAEILLAVALFAG